MSISRRQLLTPLSQRAPSPIDARQPRVGDDWLRVHRTAMACRFEVVLLSGDARHLAAARQALDEAGRLEALLTVFRETSALVRVNRTAGDAPVQTVDELFDLLTLSQSLHRATDGAFDITSTPLSRCWGFLKREGRLPPFEDVEAARGRVGMQHVGLDAAGRTIRFARPGIELNLGSIGKGYALDRMGALLRAKGCTRAVLSAGGSSVLTFGGGRAGWVIDVRSRQVSESRLARLRLRDGALATSGAGEQFVDVDGKRYGHVLDPRTGWPASGVISASVVTREAAVADALSTAFLVGGEDLAARYCESNPDTLVILALDHVRGVAPRRVLGRYPGLDVAVEES